MKIRMHTLRVWNAFVYFHLFIIMPVIWNVLDLRRGFLSCFYFVDSNTCINFAERWCGVRHRVPIFQSPMAWKNDPSALQTPQT